MDGATTESVLSKSTNVSNRPKVSFSLTLHALILVVSATCFSGCTSLGGTSLADWWQNGFKVGPNYRRPAAPVSDEWINVKPPGSVSLHQDCVEDLLQLPEVSTQPADLVEWWTVFDDEHLNSLVQMAYQQNLPLRVVGLRVLEARARRDVAVGSIFPQQQRGLGDYQRSQLSKDLGTTLNANSWRFGFDLAWELDVWGRFRRAIEAADADLDASIENYDKILLTLIGDVALNYVEIRTLQRRIEIACKNIASQERTLRGTRAKTQGFVEDGEFTEKEREAAILQQASNIAQTKASIPPLQFKLREAQNRLCILLGVPPHDLIPMLGGGAGGAVRGGSICNPEPATVRIPCPSEGIVNVGIPADLLRRRPDVRRAERQVAAQSARVGIAVSDLYPHFNLVGRLDWSARDFSDVFRGSSVGGVINPNFRWDILNYGRLTNNIRAERARFEQLAVTYQNTVLTAQAEAEDAMAGYLRSYQQVQLLQTAKQLSRDAVDNARRQSEGLEDAGLLGLSNLSNLLFTTEVTLLRNEGDLALARQAVAVNLINLYRALGGGWQIRLSPAEQPTQFQPPAEPVESNVMRSQPDTEAELPPPPPIP